MILYENIKKRREQLGISQQELAESVGYKGKSMISQIENGNVDISSSMISKIASALNCTESYLMGWEEESDENTLLKQLESSYKKGDLLKKIAEYDYEDIIRALDFLKRIKNASPEIQNAIQILLKQDQSDV